MKRHISAVLAVLMCMALTMEVAAAGSWSFSLSSGTALSSEPAIQVTLAGYSDNTAEVLEVPGQYYPDEQTKQAIIDTLNTASFFGKSGTAALAQYVADGGWLPVVAIGSHAFDNFTKLTYINLPDGITSIGEYAFFRCYALETVNIPQGVTSIGFGAFASCTNLRDIVLPNTLTIIGQSAFEACHYNLTQMDIPPSVTTIEYAAFSGCRAMEWIRIPSSVQFIGEYAFYDCQAVMYTQNQYAIDYAERHGITWYAD